ncbi:interferon-stimulated 20 kDa exonuclease-like 2 isoform X1 [Myxocyprinus asiaticus]|uniref:interferon-stimulated 20 kDa exonuclease-like 2 isoform X1 n=2 Tax=Myxocyprinus asiaticus TaxID=70543 RepID=UPI0022225EAD|nr:interferon-stimulated 20 kDa exonuclease-like 2 isoform X1 [Myxocyprinus asiaticus]XP_051574102.1 interferon-stimulated 20 kDa exonuclease-like 2 isoform X1 [Myxocyprinus asiaticus]
MSGLMFNLICDPSQGGKSSKSKGNGKHERFLGRRRFLEQKGFLKDKQNKKRNEKNSKRKRKKQRHTQINGGDPSKPGAIFPQFTTTVPDRMNEPSCSTQTLFQKPSSSVSSTACTSQGKQTHRVAPRTVGPLKYLAMDCEMVGTGLKGSISELARCSIVSYNGDVIYDKFIKPINLVTDFRTRWSGVRKQDLRNATPFSQAQKEIVKIMTGKVIVGHAIQNDFKALKYFHPACQTRDTSRIPLLNHKAGLPVHEVASLKRLTKALFNKDIQTGKGGHSSVEDAKATMELYKVVEEEWEQTLASQPVC